MKKRHSFTLIEILGVIALISILAGIGFSGYSYAMNSAKESSTQALIKRLEAGLDTIKTKCGYYPASKNPAEITISTESGNIIEKVEFGGVALNSAALKAFLSVVEPDTLLRSVKDGKLTDAWGGVIYYCHPGMINSTKYDIIAPGADSVFGSSKADTPENFTLKLFRESDDLANFAN